MNNALCSQTLSQLEWQSQWAESRAMGARPAEFEPTNLGTPSLCTAGRKVTVHWLRTAWDLNSSVMCAEQATALWPEKYILWRAMEKCSHAQTQTYDRRNYIINIKILKWVVIYMKYGTCSVDGAAEWAAEFVERKGGLSALLLLTLILHNPLDQHPHNALLQPVFYWHKSTTN